MAIALLTGAVVFVATLTRQLGIPKSHTLWAEDGAVFMRCAYFDPAPLSCLLQPYAGYVHVIPRLGALTASFASPAELSVAVGVLAALMAAFAALVTCRAIYEATGSIAAGLLGGGALALVYQAGREVGGEMANAHLTYFVASVVVITTGWLGRPVGRLDLALVALYGLSSAFAPLLVPLAIVTALLRASRWRAIIAIVVVAALLQVTVAVLMPRAEAPREVGSLVAYLDGYLDVIRSGPFGGLRVPSDRLVAVGIAVVLAVLAACWLLRDRAPGGGPGRPSPIRAIGVVAACVGAGIVAFIISVFVNGQANPRYAYIPSALAVEALLIGAAMAAIVPPPDGGLIRRGVRVACLLAVPTASVVLLVGFTRSFFLESRASGGPDYIAGYEAAIPACRDGATSIIVRISPFPASSDWFVTIPCDRVER